MLLPLTSQSAEIKVAYAQQKLDLAKITYTHVQQLLLAATPFSQETIKTIQEYCGSYAFFGYINKTHEKNKESIIHVRMSPKDAAIASFGKNDDKYCVRIHNTTRGDDNGMHKCFLKPIDCAWDPTASKIAISYVDTSYECIPIDSFVHEYYQQSISAPKYILNGIASKDILNGMDESSEISTDESSEVPVITVLQSDGDDVQIFKQRFLNQGAYDCGPVPVALVNKGKQMAIFDKKTNRLAFCNCLTIFSDYLSDITSVDFSCENPVAGAMYGQIYGDICYDSKMIHMTWTHQVFEDHSPVTLIAACKNAVAAVAGKTIKILSTEKILATYQHEGEDAPSIIKIAPDGRKFAYAASRALHVMSCESKKIEKIRSYDFDGIITWMHYGHDDSIYAAHGGTILKILP